MKNDAALRATRLMPLLLKALLVVCLVLILGNAASLWRNVRDTGASNVDAQQAWATFDELQGLGASLRAAESSQRAYLLTGEAAHREAFEHAYHDVAAHLSRLAAGPDPRMARLRTAVLPGLAAMAESVTLAAGGRPEQGLKLVQGEAGRQPFAEAEALIGELGAAERGHLHARSSVSFKAFARVAIAIDLLAVAAILILCRYILQSMRRLQDAGAQLRAANDTLEAKVAKRTQQLSQLSRHLLQLAETEKAAVANELHDELGSNLTAINLDVSAVMQRLKAQEPALAERLRRSLELLHETLDIKRRLIQGLRPSMLDSLGLCPALRIHCEDFTRRTNLPCEVDCPEDFPQVDPGWSIALYRVAQEALNNVATHAHATHVRVGLRTENGGAVLRITDDGIGIPPEAADKPMSHGLLGMRERMAQLGGRFTVRSAENGRGTIVEASVPLPPATTD